MAAGVDGRALLSGVMAPLVTPMERPGVPSAAAASALLEALARAGVRSLMLFGSAAFAEQPTPVVAYNMPRYSNPLTPELFDEVLAMPHVVGVKDSSGDLALFGHVVAAARRRPGVGVSQGSETQLVAGLEGGADGIEAALRPARSARGQGRPGLTQALPTAPLP
ncbi:dihydrodipicolinate synthase family protein [Jiangella asiatica]|uniref:Dihydrodipicolinate synthase family protein n=1 Tax=Jiangella asiatica TaxID=2530372 RepID=A0A4R5DB73_9ACTN|nr:dihydrodipicolinate synthase family protein [Jiangella asiatica]TDE09061.1 hypothetical protein E1269_15180 [Jiangella asiatica]